MVLLLHIVIALTSLVYTTYLYISPSKTKLRLSYILVASTVATGTYLTLINLSHLVSTCITGLIYLGIVSVAIVSARHKLASLTNS